MNVLTLLIIRISHGLDNVSDLSPAAVHYISNNFVCVVFLEHLSDPISLRLGVPHRLSLFDMKLPLLKGNR
jgi:hypothetical protein